MTAQRPTSHGRPWRRVLDVLIIVGLLAPALAFAVLWSRQRADRQAAERVDAWAAEVGAEGVLWPASRRAAVPAFLERDQPVTLYEPGELTPALAGVTGAEVVVTDDATEPAAPAFEPLSTASTTVDGLTARRIDPAEAAAVPIAVGQRIGEEFSRPYLFAPIRDSYALDADSSLDVSLTLAPGAYRFEMAAFDPLGQQRPAVVSVSDSETPRPVAAERFDLPEVFEAAQVVEFEVRGRAPREVRIEVSAADPDSRPKRPPRLHNWSVRRIS